jgi:hypothetical protein
MTLMMVMVTIAAYFWLWRLPIGNGKILPIRELLDCIMQWKKVLSHIHVTKCYDCYEGILLSYCHKHLHLCVVSST